MNVNDYLYHSKTDLRVMAAVNAGIGAMAIIVGGLFILASIYPQMNFGFAGHVYMGIPFISVGVVIEGIAATLFLLSLLGKKTLQLEIPEDERDRISDEVPSVPKEEIKMEIKQPKEEDFIFSEVPPIANLGSYTVNEVQVKGIEIGFRIPAPIESLPPELLLLIFQFLSSNREAISCLGVNKHWNALCNDSSLNRAWSNPNGVNLRFFRRISTQPIIKTRILLYSLKKQFKLEEYHISSIKLLFDGQSVVFFFRNFDSHKLIWLDLTNTQHHIEHNFSVKSAFELPRVLVLNSTHFLLHLKKQNKIYIFDTDSKSLIQEKEFQGLFAIDVHNELIYLELNNLCIQIYDWKKNEIINLQKEKEIPKEFDRIEYLGVQNGDVEIAVHFQGKENNVNTYNVISLEKEIRKTQECERVYDIVVKKKKYLRFFTETLESSSFFHGKKYTKIVHFLDFRNNTLKFYSFEGVVEADLKPYKYLFTKDKFLLIIKKEEILILKENETAKRIKLSNIVRLKENGKVIYAIVKNGNIYILDLKNARVTLILNNKETDIDNYYYLFKVDPHDITVKSDNSTYLARSSLTRLTKDEKVEFWTTN